MTAEYTKPLDFISALRQEKMSVDAVQALACSIPTEKAVEWASQSARLAGEKSGLTPEEEEGLAATKAWAANPNAANTAAVAKAAANLCLKQPSH